VDSEELQAVFTHQLYSDVPKVLVDLANARGGDDNITVLVIQLANDVDTAAT
jgi:protein phosphatase